MQRFATALGCDGDFRDEIVAAKAELFRKNEQPSPPSANREPYMEETGAVEFSPGDEVVLRSDSSKVGVVVQAIPAAPENRFVVFCDGAKSTLYASQLQRREAQTAFQSVSLEEFNAHICHRHR